MSVKQENFNIDFDPDEFNKTNIQKRTFIFVPIEGKDMKSEYPELNSVEEFAMLTNYELQFVWLLGNETSPFCIKKIISEVDKKKAYERAYDYSGLKKLGNEKLRSQIIEGIFPEKISRAIRKMENYIPSIRMRAKLMNEKMFSNMEKMVDLTQEELDAMDTGQRKDYATLCKTVTENIDNLIPLVENAYGVRTIKKAAGQKSTEPTLMDIAMNRG